MECFHTLTLFLTFFINICFVEKSAGQMCKISNIQIDNEDGRQNYIEVNLKKIASDEKGSCLGCNLSDNSKLGGYDQWLVAPPSFQIVFTPGELASECDTDSRNELPRGLCSKASQECSNDICDLSEIEDLAEEINEAGVLGLSKSTGNEELDQQIAIAIVHLNIGNLDRAIEDFTSILKDNGKAVVAYFGRGAAYARKGLQSSHAAQQALSDFTKAIQYDKHGSLYYIYIHRAQVYLTLQKYSEAYTDATSALQGVGSPRVYFLRGVSSLMLEAFVDAEADFRRNLNGCKDKHIKTLSHFHLGLTLYYRGKIRNAVEVFKEVLKEHPNHLEATLSLAQGFKELGNMRAASAKFKQAEEKYPNSSMMYRLRGNMLAESGDLKAARADFQKCLDLDGRNGNCLYMSGATKISLGQFYSGVKDTAKMMVSNIPAVKASPEFIKAHYLREYSRYVHTHLDEPIQSLQPDTDLPSRFLDNWVKLKKFNFTSYKEQPGLQPHIGDVDQFDGPSAELKTLLCRAEEIGKLSQVSVDGIPPNKRLNIAMGLAAIHTAQALELKWKALKSLSKSSNNEKVLHNWRDLYHIAVAYRRLATLTEPVLWVDYLPDYKGKEGHRSDIPFVRGSVSNVKVTPYFDLAFKLTKTMLEHYSGEGAVTYPGLKEDIQKATTCEELLNVARRRQINPSGFLVSTQVPSLRRVNEDYRLDGGVLMLTEDLSHRTVFALNIASTPDRTASYSAEMDHLLVLLQDEMKKIGNSKVNDVENHISHILSIAYYFFNLIPLSKGSSAVAYSVMLGLLMSVGRQITGRIPNGRLLDLEAMLSGAPDAFVLVAKRWMAIKKSTASVSSLPLVWEALPTTRNVLEVLALNSTSCV